MRPVLKLVRPKVIKNMGLCFLRISHHISGQENICGPNEGPNFGTKTNNFGPNFGPNFGTKKINFGNISGQKGGSEENGL